MEITTSTNAFLKLILFQFSLRCANSVWCIENKYLSSNEDLFAGLTLWVTTRRRGLQAFMSLQEVSEVSVHEWWQATPCWPTDPILFAIALPFQVSRCEIHLVFACDKVASGDGTPTDLHPQSYLRPNKLNWICILFICKWVAKKNEYMPYQTSLPHHFLNGFCNIVMMEI